MTDAAEIAKREQDMAAMLARAPLQEAAPPQGRVFYARQHVLMKWTPYKPTSQEFKRGKLGRWQERRPYGLGWQNAEHPPRAGAWIEDVINSSEQQT